MNVQLSKAGYRLDPENNVWMQTNYSDIAYSDGDQVEQRIASVIKQANDLTVLSTELRQHCTDWPSIYHLSSKRANIMRPFHDIWKGVDVLEIGAGCGAITRYLGECGANVLALEGSVRRAAIARSRTRDLSNVNVVAEKFDDFKAEKKFEVITLIGVLEYANLFTHGDKPTLAMLKRIRSMLKPNGKLIIAIENQFGLKYFAGALEDHIGQAMYGIEGRYRKDQPQTFGRKALANMLKYADFESSEFLAPFPDYKLPVSIVTESGFSCDGFDAAALAWQSVRRDPQLPTYCNFSLELAWPDIFKNGIALDVANSFLIIASSKQQRYSDSDLGVLAYHYSVDRVPQYCKETRFKVSANKHIDVVYNLLGASPKNGHIDGHNIIRFDCPLSDNYSNGKVMSWEFIQIVTRDGWTIEEVGEFLQRYISVLEYLLSQAGFMLSLTSSEVFLPGEFFDLIPQNIIILPVSTPVAIDTEWSLCNDVELGHLLFRGLLLMMNSITRFGRTSTGRLFSRIEFVQSVIAAAGFTLTEKEFNRFIKVESTVQEEVTGRPACEFLEWWPHQNLHQYDFADAFVERNRVVHDKDVHIGNIEAALSNREEQIANLSQALAERNGQVAALQQTVAELDRVIKVHIAEKNELVATICATYNCEPF